jgi:hypothetical protein
MPATREIMRWLLIPSMYLITIWSLCLRADRLLQFFPDLSFGLLGSRIPNLRDVMPPMPEKLSQAFRLGQLQVLAADANQSNRFESVHRYLSEAGTLLGRGEPIKISELDKLAHAISAHESHVGIVARVVGLLSFVNIIWLISIIGLLFTLAPCLGVVARPLLEGIKKLFSSVLIPVLTLAWNRLILPMLEPLSYAICLMFFAQGIRFPPEVGFYVSLTGTLGSVLAFVYSTTLHIHDNSGDKRKFLQVLYVFVALGWFPAAVLLQSKLLGFFTVIALFCALGFSVICTGLCWFIGFNDEDSMNRVTITSSLMLAVMVVVRIVFIVAFPTNMISVNAMSMWMAPFSTALWTFSAISLGLSLLISSSRWYRNDAYAKFNSLMILYLALAVGCGSNLGINSLFNVGCTFGVIWMGEKFGELPVWHDSAAIVLLFLSFAALYLIALFLNANPGFIVGLFDSSFLLEHATQ